MTGETEPTGALVVDKPSGPTSHDMVSRARRVLGTRRVGHAGTLDPMASGVLVVLVGEATKLASFATAQGKRYIAKVAFGRSTDTLDAEGAVTEERAVDLPSPEAIEVALTSERARTEQIPPVFSAIQQDGRRSYARARAGETVDLPPRPIEVRALRLIEAKPGAPPDLPSVEIEVDVGKGYYVRSLARDLGIALGVPAHLVALRRVASGPFMIDDAVSLDDPASARAALIALADVARRVLPAAELSADAAARARQGKRLALTDFTAPSAAEGPAAWFDPDGVFVAIGETRDGEGRVIRGIRGT